MDFLDEILKTAGKIWVTYKIEHTDVEKKIIDSIRKSFAKTSSKFKLKKRKIEVIFKILVVEIQVPNIYKEILDLSISTLVSLPVASVITQPVLGIFFYKAIIDQVPKVDLKFRQLFPRDNLPEDPKLCFSFSKSILYFVIHRCKLNLVEYKYFC